jgi:hypothetical protein
MRQVARSHFGNGGKMTEKEPTVVRMCYGIPYRRQEKVVEFCLFVFPHQRDWDFPQTLAPAEADEQTSRLLVPCEEAGVGGRVDEIPLGQFEASRGDVTEAVTAFLVEVTEADDDENDSRIPRRRWCRLEEAKLRIRRKPLRRLLDIAQRRLNQNGQSD